MNISVLASIWCQNLWDELILKNLIEKTSPLTPLLKGEGNIRFDVFSYDHKNSFFEDSSVKYREYFPIWIKQPRNIFRNVYNFFVFINTISRSDLVIIWWWGIIYDTENQSVRNPLDQWLFRVKVARFFRKDIIFYGVWIDIKYDNNLDKIKKIFLWAKEIFVRDNNSRDILKKFWIESKIVLDPVFYDKNFNPGVEISKIKMCIKKIESGNFTLNDLKDIDFKNKRVWIAIRSGFFNNQVNKKLWDDLEILKIKELIGFIIKSWWKIILLPHSFHETDILANDFKFLSNFKWNNIEITSSMQETYEYYTQKKLDICLAQRYHAMILSEVYEIPFVWFIYGSKTRELLKWKI